ncbi:MAG: 50S ribosomal protein L9 [Fretibacterium sp.]|nr:50S ribosomal protein L9 [Fretibacterium sp.]
MKVILKSDVKKLGRAGDLVEVSDGYARNFLLPRGLADEATTGKVAELKERQRSQKLKEAKLREGAQEAKARLQGKVIRVAATGGESGKLFGSVTSAQIAEALLEQHQVEVDKRDVKTSEPIKQPGSHPVTLRLHPGVQVEMVLQVDVQND